MDRSPEWWTAALTAGLLLIAIAQALLFLWQLRLLKRTVEDSSRAARAAESSVAAMRETATTQLRAYLCVERAWIEFPQPGYPKATVVIKNGGQTPARSVKHWIHQWCHEYPLRIELPTPPEDFVMTSDVMGPGGTHTMPIEHPSGSGPIVKEQFLDELGTAGATVYVYGEVRYSDVFGVERSTKYRLMYGGAQRSLGTSLKPCPDGNGAT
jgi:hypothetical protein